MRTLGVDWAAHGVPEIHGLRTAALEPRRLRTAALEPRRLRTAAMQGPWAAHGSPLRGVMGRGIPSREAGGWAYGDGPLEDLVFLCQM